jgi:histidinol-phosphatase (PHP family)
MHTARCGHADGSVEDMVEAAIDKGLRQVGIADHAPMLYADVPMLAMSPDELPSYVDEVLQAKEKYRGRIEVRLGIEADYHAPTQGERVSMIELYPFDYVIGSVHVLGDWIFDNPADVGRYEDIDLDDFYVEYIHTVREMAESGFYNIVGHPDLVKKFDKRAAINLIPRYRELLEAVKRAGMCYEVNTAGLRWPAREIYPEPAFVHLAAEIGVPVTFGSDAHCPEDVARDFDQALALVRGAGYREVATFQGRIMSCVPLPEGQPPDEHGHDDQGGDE